MIFPLSGVAITGFIGSEVGAVIVIMDLIAVLIMGRLIMVRGRRRVAWSRSGVDGSGVDNGSGMDDGSSVNWCKVNRRSVNWAHNVWTTHGCRDDGQKHDKGLKM